MKKLIALLLAAVMVLSMAACGDDTNADATKDTPTESTAATTAGTTDPTTETEPSEPFVPEIGEGVYSKITYTLEDNTQLAQYADTVIATVGDEELTVEELQVYYWMYVYSYLNNYAYYLSYIGLNIDAPLNEQAAPETDGTWEQFFLQEALASWHTYASLNQAGLANNVPMDEAFLTEMESFDQELADAAKEGKYDSVDQMLEENIGPGATAESYKGYMMDYYGSYSYYQYATDLIEVTDTMIAEYFSKNKDTLSASGITEDSGNVVDVRHILLSPEGGTTAEDGTTTYTDAEWTACQTKAQAVLDEWLAGEKTEDSFATLANKHSTDPGSNTTGGLYEAVTSGQMVEEFDAWCFDASRQVGDYGMVKTSYGYHIMFFRGAEAQWIRECRNSIINEKTDEFMKKAAEEYPMTVDYDNIVLGYLNLAAE